MKELGITKGKWVGVDYAGHYSIQVAPFYGARDLLDKDETNEAEANMQLCCDAGNTAQKCGLLPSGLLRQRDELKEAMKRIMFSSGTLKTVQDIAEAAIKKIEPKAEECSYWKTTGCCLPGCGTDSCEHHPLNR